VVLTVFSLKWFPPFFPIGAHAVAVEAAEQVLLTDSVLRC
jgi:hypothetical protein